MGMAVRAAVNVLVVLPFFLPVANKSIRAAVVPGGAGAPN